MSQFSQSPTTPLRKKLLRSFFAGHASAGKLIERTCFNASFDGLRGKIETEKIEQQCRLQGGVGDEIFICDVQVMGKLFLGGEAGLRGFGPAIEEQGEILGQNGVLSQCGFKSSALLRR